MVAGALSFELKLVWEARERLTAMRSGAVHGATCSGSAPQHGGVDAAATHCGCRGVQLLHEGLLARFKGPCGTASRTSSAPDGATFPRGEGF